jgi:hypothetical protein
MVKKRSILMSERKFVEWLQNAEFMISPTISALIPSDSTTICRLRINFQSFREVLESAIDEAEDRLDNADQEAVDEVGV